MISSFYKMLLINCIKGKETLNMQILFPPVSFPPVEWVFILEIEFQHRYLGITHPTAIAQTATTNIPHVLLLKQSHKTGEK